MVFYLCFIMEKYLILILLSALALGLYDFCKKLSVRDNSVMPTLFWATFSGSLFYIIFVACCGNLVNYATDFKNYHEFCLIIIKSIIVGSSWICGYYALRELPLSIAAPIRATAPLWTFAGGVFLFHEIPSIRQGAGMICIFIGYYLFSIIGKLEGISFTKHRGIHLIFLATLLGATSALYDKYLLTTVGISKNTVQFYFSIELVIFLGTCWLIRKLFFKDGIKFVFRYSIILTGVLLIIADYLYFYAITMPNTQIAILSLIRRASCVVTFLLGFGYLKDSNFKKKSLALLLIFIGLVILSWK